MPGGAKWRPRMQVKASLGAFGGPLAIAGERLPFIFDCKNRFLKERGDLQFSKGEKLDLHTLQHLRAFRFFEIRVFQFLQS